MFCNSDNRILNIAEQLRAQKCTATLILWYFIMSVISDGSKLWLGAPVQVTTYLISSQLCLRKQLLASSRDSQLHTPPNLSYRLGLQSKTRKYCHVDLVTIGRHPNFLYSYGQRIFVDKSDCSRICDKETMSATHHQDCSYVVYLVV